MDDGTPVSTINLATGDEVTIGPALSATTLEVKFRAEAPPDLVVRDALTHRQQEIDKLRERVRELEAEHHASASDIATQIVALVCEALGGV